MLAPCVAAQLGLWTTSFAERICLTRCFRFVSVFACGTLILHQPLPHSPPRSAVQTQRQAAPMDREEARPSKTKIKGMYISLLGPSLPSLLGPGRKVKWGSVTGERPAIQTLLTCVQRTALAWPQPLTRHLALYAPLQPDGVQIRCTLQQAWGKTSSHLTPSPQVPSSFPKLRLLPGGPPPQWSPPPEWLVPK